MYEHSKLKILSGGESPLVETCIVLKIKRKHILLDEAFLHLSALNIEPIKEVIVEEKEEKAMILSDHLHEHVAEIVDSIHVLRQGATKNK